jgi:hypothetical protein
VVLPNGTVRVSGNVDFERSRRYVFNITVTDSGGVARSAVRLNRTTEFVITVSDVNEAPTVRPTYTFVAPENSPAGYVVGWLNATDQDITLQVGAQSLRAGWAAAEGEGGGGRGVSVCVVSFSHIPSPACVPRACSLCRSTVRVCVCMWCLRPRPRQPGQADPLTYTFLNGTDLGIFAIASGNISLLADVLDFETRVTYVLQVSVRDPQGLVTNTTVTVTVADVNDAPTYTNCPAVEDRVQDFYLLPGYTMVCGVVRCVVWCGGPAPVCCFALCGAAWMEGGGGCRADTNRPLLLLLSRNVVDCAGATAVAYPRQRQHDPGLDVCQHGHQLAAVSERVQGQPALCRVHHSHQRQRPLVVRGHVLQLLSGVRGGSGDTGSSCLPSSVVNGCQAKPTPPPAPPHFRSRPAPLCPAPLCSAPLCSAPLCSAPLCSAPPCSAPLCPGPPCSGPPCSGPPRRALPCSTLPHRPPPSCLALLPAPVRYGLCFGRSTFFTTKTDLANPTYYSGEKVAVCSRVVVNESAPVGTVLVAGITVADVEGNSFTAAVGNNPLFTLVPSGAGRFDLVTAQALNFEVSPAYIVRLLATDTGSPPMTRCVA